MYYCTDCKKKFFDPKIYFERHGLTTPPYEKIMLCPYCESEDIAYIEAFKIDFRQGLLMITRAIIAIRLVKHAVKGFLNLKPSGEN